MQRNRLSALIAVLLVAGCGKETTPPATAPTAANSATSAATPISPAELDGVTKANAPYHVALIVKTRNNPFFTPMIAAFQDAVQSERALPQVESPPQETDKEIQFNMVKTVASGGAQAILIAPADSKGIVPALKAAQDGGAVVINIDNRVDRASAAAQGLTLAGYVGADNEEGGRMAGEALAQRLGGKGAVAILEGIRGADNAEARRRGFLAGAKGLQVVAQETANWDMQQAYGKMATLLQAHPDLAGVFCANDDMAIGAMRAIKEAGKTGKTVVVGYDNIPNVKSYLDDGELFATIEQHPDLMGKYGARMAIGILNGTVPRGREMLVPLELVRGKTP